jgi:hypothetical protein
MMNIPSMRKAKMPARPADALRSPRVIRVGTYAAVTGSGVFIEEGSHDEIRAGMPLHTAAGAGLVCMVSVCWK